LELRYGDPEEVGMSGERVRRLTLLAKSWVDHGMTPALVVLVARRGVIVLHEAFGKLTPEPDSQPLPRADVYVQDEVDVRHHPTLTRIWSHKGRDGQRLVRAPGISLKAVGFAAVDWRDGWCSWGFAPRRTVQPFVNQLEHVVERSHARGRIAMVLLDNAKSHTPLGAKVVREALARHGDRLRLIPTPAYDPQANPTERLWPRFRRAVTHNQWENVVNLFRDAYRYFEDLDAHPERALRHIGGPFAIATDSQCQIAGRN
jgi:transposase